MHLLCPPAHPPTYSNAANSCSHIRYCLRFRVHLTYHSPRATLLLHGLLAGSSHPTSMARPNNKLAYGSLRLIIPTLWILVQQQQLLSLLEASCNYYEGTKQQVVYIWIIGRKSFYFAAVSLPDIYTYEIAEETPQ